MILFVSKDYQRHIAVLKESLCAKEEHYNMLQSDVSYFSFIFCYIFQIDFLFLLLFFFQCLMYVNLFLIYFYIQVEELRARLEEKNRLIEKKTQNAMQAVQERNRFSNEFTELKDHMEIKDRKINVLQRKVSKTFSTIDSFYQSY